MILRYFALDPDGPIPRDVALDITCDGDHGFLDGTTERFPCGGVGAGARPAIDLAIAAGWKYSPPVTLGPCCSGKPKV